MDIRRFNSMLRECLGECGEEAVIDAINFYLLHCKHFPCNEDKLILLSVLFDNPYAESYYYEHNALKQFNLTFEGGKID